MRTSAERILTTHVGSLPRPKELLDLIWRRDAGEAIADAVFDAQVREAVAAAVERQLEAGIDIVSDGEMGKINFLAYTGDRLTGFEGRVRYGFGQGECPPPGDLLDFPSYLEAFASVMGDSFRLRRCTGAVRYTGHHLVRKDLENFGAALERTPPVEAFLNASGPGTLTLEQANEYYPTVEAYVWALAEAMREEYEAIVDAGYLLQIDCPDLALGRHLNIQRPFTDDDDFLKHAEMCMEATNHALRNVPAESSRLHICWGNYEGPHHLDVPLAKIIGMVLKAKPMAISLEAANPRHGHEWKVFREVKVPRDKVLLPGVIDVRTNYIEHPELVADRICQFADMVGRERVIASTDCGFATVAAPGRVDPDISYAKLTALAQGAAIASTRLW
jgi:5-methyltetrahydropteroyltriglutamate--homocysteine methyltransferase